MRDQVPFCALLTLRDVPEAQRRPMTRAESEAFIRCSLGEQDEEPRRIGVITSDVGEKFGKLPPQLMLISARIQSGAGQDLLFSAATVLFLASLCASPGRCVLWAHYLVVRTHETGAPVDMDRLAFDFPNGFPTDEGALAIWEAQKRPPRRPMPDQSAPKPLSPALQFLTSARKAMPATLGDRDRIAAMNDVMRIAIECRMRFEPGDAERLQRLNDHTCVGVFRPLDDSFYARACHAGGTYPRLWERRYGIEPWMAPERRDHRGEAIGAGRVAAGIRVLIGGDDFDPNLPRIGDLQVWHCTSLSTDPDQIVICRYALPADRQWPLSSDGKVARRKIVTREVWKALFPEPAQQGAPASLEAADV